MIKNHCCVVCRFSFFVPLHMARSHSRVLANSRASFFPLHVTESFHAEWETCASSVERTQKHFAITRVPKGTFHLFYVPFSLFNSSSSSFCTFFCYGTKIEKMLKHFRNVNQCNDFWNRRRVGSVETLVKGSAGLIPRRTRKLSRSIECQFIYANCWACDLLFVMTVISFRGERSDWDFLAFLTSQRGIYWLSQIIDREIYCL